MHCKVCYAFFVLAFQLFKASSHSWLACVDYTEKNGAIWNPEKCRGFARDSQMYARKDSFGVDRGFDHKPGQDGKACKTDYSDNSYSEEYPKAVYFPGQQVVIVHPMKNHGAASCTNRWIPDHGSAVYRSKRNKNNSNMPLSKYKRKVADLGVSLFGNPLKNPDGYPKPGYQNAPNFCRDTDKSMASYSFNVPRKLSPGEYTFVWTWAFNSADDIYSTCFDVTVAKNKNERNRVLQSMRVSNLQVHCGGTTSNNRAGSDVGCDDASTRILTSQPTASTVPTKTSTQPTSSNSLPIMTSQMSGSIDLGVPRKSVTRRTIEVNFNCSVKTASVWNGRLLERSEKGKLKVVQENLYHVKSGVVNFFVTFNSCDVTKNSPTATILSEE